jgi:hypothetical protein
MRAFEFTFGRRSHMRLNVKPRKTLTRPCRDLYAIGGIGNDQVLDHYQIVRAVEPWNVLDAQPATGDFVRFEAAPAEVRLQSYSSGRV